MNKKKQTNSPKTKTLKKRWDKLSKLSKIFIIALIIMLLLILQAYALAFWYQKKHSSEPLTYGVTFIPRYARYYNLNPQETFLALRDDLGFKRFRLVSYWDEIEKQPKQYDFSELDWQFEKVNEVGG